MDNNKGSLILKALSPDADETQIIAYLEKRAKSIPPEKIPLLLKSLPVVLSRNVAKETGQLVIEHLEELGAVALFLPAQEALQREQEGNAAPEGDKDLYPGKGRTAKAAGNSAMQRWTQLTKELWIVLAMLGIAWMLNYSIASQYLLLGLYTLPAVVSAYIFGRRQAVLTAFASILLVGLVNYCNPGRFDSVQFAGVGGNNQWYHIVSWGCILLVTAYTMGTLYERNKNKVEELRQTYQGLLIIMRHFIAQDEDKENHCFRVSIYATRIAASMGLEKEDIEDIRSAALLHDIGHLKISRSILLKAARINRLPSSLRGEPFAEAHPLSGPMGRILPMLIGQYAEPGQAAKEAAVEPPLGARILAIADAYDFLTTDNPPQHAALSPLQAKARILADTDSGFDATVVKAFAAAVDRMDLDLPSMLL
ncbi:MAG: HD domain-containing protein [Desulfobulbus sp.]|nr:HD domain-containing protein [Desulfobulbus sp.]